MNRAPLTHAFTPLATVRRGCLPALTLLSLLAACTDETTAPEVTDGETSGQGVGAGTGPRTPTIRGTGGSTSGGSLGNKDPRDAATDPADSSMVSDPTGGSTTAPETTCQQEGALRCAASGSGARETCVAGSWVMAEACADGMICDGSNQAAPGACASADSFCQGRANEKVCAEAVMHTCNADAISAAQEQCESPRHCQAGLEAGACATCIAGETHRCSGADLEVCAADGQSFQHAATCETAALCNAESRACTDGVCRPGTYTCGDGDVLQVCNQDGTGYDEVQRCMPGLCDELNGQCDTCVPGASKCEGNAPAMCGADGQGFQAGACRAPASRCTGQGVCVECVSTSDCTSSPPRCRANVCNSGAGTCETVVSAGESCRTDAGRSGTCTSQGDCVECRGDGDCSGSTPYCDTGDNRCVECLQGRDTCSTARACQTAYCDSNNRCAERIDEGAACGVLRQNVCDSRGSCVECVTASDCDNPSNFTCESNRCVEKAYCGDGVIDREREEQCDDTSNSGSCGANCKLLFFGSCSNASGSCSAGFAGSGFCYASSAFPGYRNTCVPLCDSNTSCPRVPGWSVSCTNGFCMLGRGCSSERDCPVGLGCATVNGSERVCLAR